MEIQTPHIMFIEIKMVDDTQLPKVTSNYKFTVCMRDVIKALTSTPTYYCHSNILDDPHSR